MADIVESRRSRRALLGAAAGAAAATLVGAVTRPLPAEASTDHAAYLNNETAADVLVAQSLRQTGYPNSGKGNAITAKTASGIGVFAETGFGTAVRAHSGANRAIYATSTSGDAAVRAHSGAGFGVHASSASDGAAVLAQSDSGMAVQAESIANEGVFASTAAGDHAGVFGRNDGGGWGVFGWTQLGTPRMPVKPAVVGLNAGYGAGVLGYCGASASLPTGLANVAVYGVAPLASGRGGAFSGAAAQVRLIPSNLTSHPGSGEIGDLFLDANKRLWFCKGGSTWVQLA